MAKVIKFKKIDNDFNYYVEELTSLFQNDLYSIKIQMSSSNLHFVMSIIFQIPFEISFKLLVKLLFKDTFK